MVRKKEKLSMRVNIVQKKRGARIFLINVYETLLPSDYTRDEKHAETTSSHFQDKITGKEGSDGIKHSRRRQGNLQSSRAVARV